MWPIGHSASGQLAKPARLPAPVALDAGCGLVAIWPDGRVRLLPHPDRPTYPPGYQVAPHVGVTVRRGRVVVFDHGAVRWRSRGQLATGGWAITSAAAGPGGLAFVVNDALYLAPRPVGQMSTWPIGHERLAARGVTLVGTTAAGAVTLAWRHRVLVVRRYGFDGQMSTARSFVDASAAWDASRVLVASGGRLVATDGGRLATLARGLPARAQVSPQDDGRIVLTTARQVLLLNARGRLLSSGTLPHGQVLDTVLATSGARAAFASAPAGAGTSTRRVLWTLRPGARRATSLGTFTRPATCAGYPPGGFSGRFLLLRVPTGTVRVVDTARPGRSVDLTPLARALTRRHRAGTAAWLADRRRA
jgi:hypothetical protein